MAWQKFAGEQSLNRQYLKPRKLGSMVTTLYMFFPIQQVMGAA
jgi:hypothetical protein